MTRTASGWEIQLTHPSTGRVIRPDVLSNPEFLPSLNSFAEARIPIRKSEGLSEWPTDTDVTLWFDGVEQPIDTLTDVEQASDRTIIEAEGGVELDNRIQENYIEERRHVAAENLIANQTSYAADVDTPTFDTLTDQVQQNPTTTAEFNDLYTKSNDDTQPVDTSGDNIEIFDTNVVAEAEDNIAVAGSQYSDADFSSESGVESNTLGVVVSFDIELDYTIPANEWKVGVRQLGSGTEPTAGYKATVDGTAVTPFADGIGVAPTGTLEWRQFEENNDFDLTAGTHTIEIEIINTSDSAAKFDIISVYDDRYNYTFDNTSLSGVTRTHLDGPENKPDAVDIEFDDAITAFIFETVEATLTIDDTSNNQSIALSFDRGNTYTVENNSDNINRGNVESIQARLRITLSRYSPSGAQSQTPRFGYASQTVDSYTLTSDTRLEYLLLDESFDNNLEAVLNDIAGTEYIWSYNLDSNGNPQISWTQPGARTASDSQEIEATTTARKSTKTYDSVTVKGSSQSERAEEFDGSTSFVALDENNIVPGSESVYNPSDNTRFQRAIDYEMDYQAGEIRILSAGDMNTSTTYNIDYSHEAEGSYPDTSGRQLVETIAGVVTDRQAEQLAYIIHSVDPELSETGWTADILIPRGSDVFDPLDALSLEQLNLPDAATPLAVREPPERTPQGIRLRLGGQRELEGALREISDQLRTVSRRS